jgi:hypothetical protein
MSYIHKIDGCFADKIGDGGVSAAGYDRWRTEAVKALARVEESADREYMTVLKLPEQRNDIDVLQQAAKRLRETEHSVPYKRPVNRRSIFWRTSTRTGSMFSSPA